MIAAKVKTCWLGGSAEAPPTPITAVSSELTISSMITATRVAFDSAGAGSH
jgi:hypothetical protein